MKKKTAKLIRHEIRMPYCNWNKFRALEYTPVNKDDAIQYDNSVEYRTRSALGLFNAKVNRNKKDTWKDLVDGIDLQETEFLTLREAKLLAAIRFGDKLREAKSNGIFTGKLVESCGMDQTSAARLIKGTENMQVRYVTVENGVERLKIETNGLKRGFATLPEAILVIADRITECTAHHLLFGEEKDIVLPGKYSYIADMLTEIYKSSDRKQSIENDMDTLLRIGNGFWRIEQKYYKEQHPKDNTLLLLYISLN